MEINGIWVPSVWSHDGLVDYFYPTPELRAAVVKDKDTAAHFEAQKDSHCVTVPTRRALQLANERYKLGIDVKVGTTKGEALEAKLAEVVPLAEWTAARVVIAAEEAKEKLVEEKPVDVKPVVRG